MRAGRRSVAAAVALGLFAVAGASVSTREDNRPVLRVCADPNNLPFSNRRREGFENRLVELLARDMEMRVEYLWWAQRRGFFRSTLNEGLCDLVPGMASSVERAWPTRPYYRSTYVFVSRQDRGLDIRSFDDTALASRRIGVQIVGDDYANTPPVDALARRGLVRQLVGYSVVGDYSKPDPPARVVDAVTDGSVDLAVVWGPLAGYFALRSRVPLKLVPVQPQIDTPFLPFVFDIAMGTRRGDTLLHVAVERALERRQEDVDRLLAEYGVPRVDRP